MQKRLEAKLNDLGFSIAVEDILNLTEEEYRLARANTLGASDSSKLLGVNPFPNGTIDNLIYEKINNVFDETIGQKASVRMGKDLEPFILNKIEEILNIKILKPTSMYLDKRTGLSVNFDGVVEYIKKLVPAEIKLVTQFGRKYYNWKKATVVTNETTLENIPVIEAPEIYPENLHKDEDDVKTLVEYHSTLVGIPAYYYTQLQQQIYFLGEKYGFLFALDVANWNIVVFKVARNERVISALKEKSIETYTRIKLAKDIPALELEDDGFDII